ncbi:signal recognition particle-docking protein FtsY [Aporhodopirellula aestuarii]|uniref:Signal recognition particle receptor FtsY n=1 Tax=Aporhodopirellula aestuarii TaxID=2950107 RepID=A0ABT0U6F2_9BACT|nr:signal recognition particle-docking protein FtsY [Aporhodopirellula aestuarii]MCM2372517.1 signal recognition particle-docking protein FtsY [Aporhodopirellula aestuarii]
MAFWRSKKTNDESPENAAQAPEAVESAATPGSAKKDGGGGILTKLSSGLQKTRRVLGTDIRDLFKSEGRLVDEEFLGELFARLIRTDMGTGPANKIREEVARQFRGRVVHLEEVIQTITEEIRSQLRQDHGGLAKSESPPTVILVVGVNGSGKTTSIGKLAHHLTANGHSLVLGAGDTFRAAAVEQLTIWAGRIGCEIVTGKSGADPASVAYQTVDKAIEVGADYAIIDTAGRLQTQSNLMQELQKIRNVIGKRLPGSPHEVLLVLDATAGQNAISQAKGFSAAAGCTGIVLAKLDGSAKGGVVLPIREQFQLPVKFVGLGEGMQDMAAFDPDSFAEALLKG